MSSILVIRTLLVVVLFVTAHVIRPFSIKNVTRHLLYSTRSFAFVLPGQKRAEFDTANDLALSLSDGWFQSGARRFVEAPAAAGPDSWQLALKLVTLDGANRVISAPKPEGKRAAPARRMPRVDRIDSDDLIAGIGWNEEAAGEEAPASEALPVNEDSSEESAPAPMWTPPTAARTGAEMKATPIAFLLPSLNAIRKIDCRRQETPIVKLIALTDGKAVRLSLRLAQIATVAPECEGETMIETEAETGPEIQWRTEFFGDPPPMPTPEPAESLEMHPARPAIEPLKCALP
ncbi:MAG: hypothetical protein ACKVX9_12445 [Blastocatellia bacterium]